MMSTLLRQATIFPAWLQPEPAFQRKIEVDFKVRDYRVKTVHTAGELRQVLGLRRSVFHYEFARKWISLKSDKDSFDDVADHLAIFDEKKKKVAGVYRLIPSHHSSRFYSTTEFDLGKFLALPGRKLELSRACINREYRNGIVIGLLWKGLAEYAKAAQIDWLFGLSSINTVNVGAIAAIQDYFKGQGLLDLSQGITPKGKYRIDGFDAVQPAVLEGEALVPPLFRTYIKAGAKICSQPVIDRDFNCADWLTVLDMRQMSKAFDRRFMRE